MSLSFFMSKIRVLVSDYTLPKAMTDQSTLTPEFFLTFLFFPRRAPQVDSTIKQNRLMDEICHLGLDHFYGFRAEFKIILILKSNGNAYFDEQGKGVLCSESQSKDDSAAH